MIPLDSYEPISLDQMEGSKLMDRIDSKYVTTLVKLDDVLRMASDHYRILYTGGLPVQTYDTLYFDTPDRQMYLMHHNGRLTRTKVRTRTYVNTGESFLEIKRKNNHGRTKKKRIRIPGDIFEKPFQDDASNTFLQEKTIYKGSELSPALSTGFKRITLVGKEGGERITIDFELAFHNFRNGADVTLGPAVIMELKRSGNIQSPMTDILSQLRIHPLRISKYCIGSALTDPSLKQNRFKNKIRNINKIAYAVTDTYARI